MKRETYEYLVQDNQTAEMWLYGSVTAMLLHEANPLAVTSQRISQIRRKNGGYPVQVNGCTIHRLKKWSVTEVRYDLKINPVKLPF